MDGYEQIGMGLGDEPQLARAREADPSTSWDAAKGVGDTTASQRDVLALLREYPKGLTDEELVRVYGRREKALGLKEQSPQSIRSRRSELRDRGLVSAVPGTKRRMERGGMGQVWVAAPRRETAAPGLLGPNDCGHDECEGPGYDHDAGVPVCGSDFPGDECPLR